jgi:hypothetical protein
MADCQASRESVWIVDFLRPIVVNAGNQGSTALTKNLVFHDRLKHIDIQYHCARDLVKEGRIKREDVGRPPHQIPAPRKGYQTFSMGHTLGSQRGGALEILDAPCTERFLRCSIADTCCAA